MALSRKSFRDAEEWAATYHPTVQLSQRPTRAGGTLFGLGKTDQSHLLTVDREFIWTVLRSGNLEYVAAGKRRGASVVGYLVTDNPVLFRDLNFRWAIGYRSFNWSRWEREQENAEEQKQSPKDAKDVKANAAPAQPIQSECAPDKKDAPTITAPFQEALTRAAKAVIEKLTPASTHDTDGAARNASFEETRSVEPPVAQGSPTTTCAPLDVVVGPHKDAVGLEPEKPPLKPATKKRAKRAKEAPSPDLPFPEPPAPINSTDPEPVFVRPPRPKPRPYRPLPLPPETAPSTPSGPDPMPTPPPPPPKPITVDLGALTAREIVLPPSVAPPVPSSPDPLPTPAPPPRPKRFRTRVLPVGADAALLDREIFGPWPNAVPCHRCSASGFIPRPGQGLAECEACDGRGWNPPPDSPLEIRVSVE